MKTNIWKLFPACLAGIFLTASIQNSFAQENHGLVISKKFFNVSAKAGGNPARVTFTIRNTGSTEKSYDFSSIVISRNIGFSPGSGSVTVAPGSDKSMSVELLCRQSTGSYISFLHFTVGGRYGTLVGRIQINLYCAQPDPVQVGPPAAALKLAQKSFSLNLNVNESKKILLQATNPGTVETPYRFDNSQVPWVVPSSGLNGTVAGYQKTPLPLKVSCGDREEIRRGQIALISGAEDVSQDIDLTVTCIDPLREMAFRHPFSVKLSALRGGPRQDLNLVIDNPGIFEKEYHFKIWSSVDQFGMDFTLQNGRGTLAPGASKSVPFQFACRNDASTTWSKSVRVTLHKGPPLPEDAPNAPISEVWFDMQCRKPLSPAVIRSATRFEKTIIMNKMSEPQRITLAFKNPNQKRTLPYRFDTSADSSWLVGGKSDYDPHNLGYMQLPRAPRPGEREFLERFPVYMSCRGVEEIRRGVITFISGEEGRRQDIHVTLRCRDATSPETALRFTSPEKISLSAVQGEGSAQTTLVVENPGRIAKPYLISHHTVQCPHCSVMRFSGSNRGTLEPGESVSIPVSFSCKEGFDSARQSHKIYLDLRYPGRDHHSMGEISEPVMVDFTCHNYATTLPHLLVGKASPEKMELSGGESGQVRIVVKNPANIEKKYTFGSYGGNHGGRTVILPHQGERLLKENSSETLTFNLSCDLGQKSRHIRLYFYDPYVSPSLPFESVLIPFICRGNQVAPPPLKPLQWKKPSLAAKAGNHQAASVKMAVANPNLAHSSSYRVETSSPWIEILNAQSGIAGNTYENVHLKLQCGPNSGTRRGRVTLHSERSDASSDAGITLQCSDRSTAALNLEQTTFYAAETLGHATAIELPINNNSTVASRYELRTSSSWIVPSSLSGELAGNENKTLPLQLKCGETAAEVRTGQVEVLANGITTTVDITLQCMEKSDDFSIKIRPAPAPRQVAQGETVRGTLHLGYQRKPLMAPAT